MSDYQKQNDPCEKCGAGTYKHLKYVRSAAEGFPRTDCIGCPAEEHMHMSCDTCGYTVLGQTVAEAAKAAAAPPPPAPPPTEAAASAMAAPAGRSKNPRGG